MSEYTYTIAELTAKEGRVNDLREILVELAQQTRKEKGAIEYFFILDQQKANTIVSYEKWENAKEESLHWKTNHLVTAIKQMEDVLEEAPIIHKGYRII